MTFTKTAGTKFKKIKSGEDDFLYRSGMCVVPRAQLELSPDISNNERNIIEMAYLHGKLTLVVNVPEKDFMWEKLSG